MADFYIRGESSSGQTLQTGEEGYIGRFGELWYVVGDPVNINGTSRLTVLGSLTALGGTAVDIDPVLAFTMATGPDATVYANLDAIIGSVSGYFTLLNAGTITSAGLWGVFVVSSDGNAVMTLDNSGTITGDTTGVTLNGGGGPVFVTNSGTISSLGTTGLEALSTTAVHLVNSGIIQSRDTAVDANSDGAVEFYNSGTIVGDVELGSNSDLFDGGGGSVSGRVLGAGGLDTLKGGALSDELYGGDDADLLNGRGGDDTLFGDNGDDTVIGGDGNDDLFGGAQNDRIFGHSGADQINGNLGNDTVWGGAGDDTVAGGQWNDTVGGGAGDDLVFGNDGFDILYGGSGDDQIFGGNGNDTIFGGSGHDELYGGANADVFVFRRGFGADDVLDFKQGDRLDLSGMGVNNFLDLANTYRVEDGPSGTLIDFGGGDTLFLADVDYAGLSFSDGIF